MSIRTYKIFFVILVNFFALSVFAQDLKYFIPNVSVIQGEPAQIIIEGVYSISNIKSITVDGKTLSPFIYEGKVQVVYGVDINHEVGNFPIVVKMKSNATLNGTLTINPREKPTADFTIPDSLGGTTPTGEKNVLSLLSKENKIISTLWTNPKKLWTGKFIYPITNPVVTDNYGYNRDTGTTTITHKGTDFRATNGTPVYAINRGVIRLVKSFALYGNTVVVDHGQGVMSFYMHLSKISVQQGFLIKQGQKIGESGHTGYAEGEHLHLTIRVNNASIDPMKFFALYGEK